MTDNDIKQLTALIEASVMMSSKSYKSPIVLAGDDSDESDVENIDDYIEHNEPGQHKSPDHTHTGEQNASKPDGDKQDSTLDTQQGRSRTVEEQSSNETVHNQ